jgi:competence protein ComEA
MKKSAIWILLTVTLVFAAFVGGLYIGRNTRYSDIQINGGMTSTPLNSVLPSSSNLPQNNAGDSSSGISVPATPTVTSSVSVFPININTATAEDLDQLPDIGPVLAQRIVAYRNEFGHFSCVEDLLHVNGIGEKTLAKIREYITV